MTSTDYLLSHMTSTDYLSNILFSISNSSSPSSNCCSNTSLQTSNDMSSTSCSSTKQVTSSPNNVPYTTASPVSYSFYTMSCAINDISSCINKSIRNTIKTLVYISQELSNTSKEGTSLLVNYRLFVYHPRQKRMVLLDM